MIDNVAVGAASGGILVWLVMQIKDSLKNIEINTEKICNKVGFKL